MERNDWNNWAQEKWQQQQATTSYTPKAMNTN